MINMKMLFFLIALLCEGSIEHWLSLDYASDCRCASLVNDDLLNCLERSVGSGVCLQYDVTDEITYTSEEYVCTKQKYVSMAWKRNELMARIPYTNAFLKRLQLPGYALSGCNATRITWAPSDSMVSCLEQDSYSSSMSDAASTESSHSSSAPVDCYMDPASSAFESANWAVFSQQDVLVIEIYGAVMIPSGIPFVKIQVELTPCCEVTESGGLDHYKTVARYNRRTQQVLPTSARKLHRNTGVMLALALFLRNR